MKPVIAIAGPSGSGKSTVASILARRLGMTNIDSGAIFRQLAKEHGLDLIAFGLYAEKHPEIDRELDARLAAEVKRSRRGAVLQGRLAAWTCVQNDIPAHKIWLTASLPVRTERTIQREGGNRRETARKIDRRDKDNCRRYLKTYGLDLNDYSIYDAVVNTDGLTISQVVASIIRKLPKVWLKKSKTPPKRRPLRKPSRKSPPKSSPKK